jgi:hypothetical protein
MNAIRIGIQPETGLVILALNDGADLAMPADKAMEAGLVLFKAGLQVIAACVPGEALDAVAIMLGTTEQMLKVLTSEGGAADGAA